MCYRSFLLLLSFPFFLFFFFNDTATTEIYTLSLHDALPISQACKGVVPLERKALHGGAQLTQQFLESCLLTAQPLETLRDRKSTRLNSSHSQISYAVFCLKKKKKIKMRYTVIVTQ